VILYFYIKYNLVICQCLFGAVFQTMSLDYLRLNFTYSVLLFNGRIPDFTGSVLNVQEVCVSDIYVTVNLYNQVICILPEMFM